MIKYAQQDCKKLSNMSYHVLTVDFLEGEPVDDHPEVVKKGKGDDHGPVVAETTSWVEDEGPVLGRPGLGGAAGAVVRAEASVDVARRAARGDRGRQLEAPLEVTTTNLAAGEVKLRR